MFQVNRTENSLTKLDARRFADLNLRERDHLQEWLAKRPDTLGEDLLIIQKEFDGFADTRERLDLLALDKEGQLVVIENKLDDSGRDVTWQAMKYAAYCSSLTKAQIVDIYQLYLDRYCDGGNAAARICDFLDADDLEEVVLNQGNDQRFMLIAANFRKEVTATVLWLLGHGIRVQCFKVVPYSFRDDLFIDIQQIIPTPEAEEFMIGISSKETEEKSAKVALKSRHKLRLEFWEQLLQALRERDVQLFQNVNPSKENWISAGAGVASCGYAFILTRNDVRVQLNFERSDPSENKCLYDQLFAQRDEIETDFGMKLEWKRMDDRKASRIVASQAGDGFNPDCWPELIDWLSAHIVRLEAALGHRLKSLDPAVVREPAN